MAAAITFTSCQKEEGYASDMSFNLDVSKVTDESALVTLIPSDRSETYYYSVMQKSEYDAAGGDAAVVASVVSTVSDPEVKNSIVSGYVEKYVMELQPATEYVLFAFPMTTDGRASEKVCRMDFTTAAPVEKFECEISVRNVSAVSVLSTFSPADKNEKYYVGVVEKKEYDRLGGGIAAVQADLEKIIENKLKENPSYSRKVLIERIVLAGDITSGSISLVDNTEYYVWAAPVDADGMIVKKPAVSEFSTPSYVPSDAVVTGDIPKYYDGDALAEYSYNYGYARGYAVSPVTVEVDRNTVEYYMTLLPDGYESVEQHPDIEMLSILLKQGVKNFKSGNIFYLDWNPIVVCTVGIDKDGNFGPVARKRIELSKDGVSPIEEIVGQ